MRVPRSALAAVVAAVTALTLVPAPAPALTGGQSALGNPAVVALATFDGSRWRVCSAALLRPRVLLTAAHCLTAPGGSTPVTRVRVFPPGARARVYAVTGPRRPSPARVLRWWVAADLDRGTVVQPDDVAAVLLDRDLAPRAFTRVASVPELKRWRASGRAVEHVGYGRAAGSSYSPVPQWMELPFRSLSLGGSLGSTFSTSATAAQSLCAGDSGGPAYVQDGTSAYLIGTMAGASGACASGDAAEPSNLGFATIGYLGIVNAALAAAGNPAIPSAPQSPGQAARNRDVTVRWTAPAAAPDAVVAYDVLDGSGAAVCQTTDTSCTVRGLPDGTYSYEVRSRNAEGEGDAIMPASAAVVASPPAPPAPTVARVSRSRYQVSVTTIADRTSAVVTSYTVRTQAGVTVCVLIPPTPQASQVDCAWTPARGTYRLTVQADTEMGPSPVSTPSASVSVR